MPETTTPQDIEELRQRYEALRDKKTQAEARLSDATKELERLRAEAMAKYGTDDLADLQKKLQEVEAENLRKRKDYEKLLDKVEAELQTVEERYAQER